MRAQGRTSQAGMGAADGLNLLKRREIVLSAAVFGLFLATSSIVRVEGSGLSEAAVVLSRLASIGAVAFVAALVGGREHDLPMWRILRLGIICTAIYLVFLVLQTTGATLGPLEQALPAWRCAAFFSGLAEGIFLLLSMALFCSLAPRYSAAGVTLGCLFSALLVLLPSLLPAGVESWLKAILPLAGALLARPALAGVERSELAMRAPAAPTQPHASQGLALRRHADPRLLISLACTCVLLFLSGLDTKLVSMSGVPLGPHNWVYQLAAIATCLVLALLTMGRGLVWSLDSSVLLTAPFFLLAYLLLGSVEGTGFWLMGLLAKVGYTLFQALLWVCLARIAYADRASVPALMTLFYAGMRLAALLGRGFAESYAAGGEPLSPSSLTTGALVLICLCCLGLLAVRLIPVRAGQADLEGEASAEPNEAAFNPQEKGAPHTFEASMACLSAHFGLSEREQQVFAGLVRGRSNNDLAEELHLSASTVRTYVQRIYNKTNCLSRKEVFEVWEGFREQGAPAARKAPPGQHGPQICEA